LVLGVGGAGVQCFPFDTGGVGIWVVSARNNWESLGSGLVCEQGVLGLVWSFWIAKVTVVSARCKRDSTCTVLSLSVSLSMICSASSSDWSSSDPSEAVFACSSVSEVLGLSK